MGWVCEERHWWCLNRIHIPVDTSRLNPHLFYEPSFPDPSLTPPGLFSPFRSAHHPFGPISPHLSIPSPPAHHKTPCRSISTDPSNFSTSAMDGGSQDGITGAGEAIGGDLVQIPKKGKSCKGCLYYSSLLKSDARYPICIGITRSLPQVPGYIVSESEVESTKEGRSLAEFKYACVGYSVFFDNKDNPNDKQENRAELPVCAGIELLVDKRASSADHVPSHVHNKGDGTVRSQPWLDKPAHSHGEEFLSRFKRNASLVAYGVTRNLNKVGNYVKENLDYIVYRRPK